MIAEVQTIDPEILKLYKPADRYLLVNEEDERLKTIEIPLPEPPPLETIDGYGLHPSKQKFTIPKYPNKLLMLERSSNTLEEIYNTLEIQKDYYEQEIKWIEQQWDRRLNGYWCYINGKPTYIDGWQYAFCTFWNIDIGIPDYRSRDRKFFLFARYCYTTTDAFYPFMVRDHVTDRPHYFAEYSKALQYAGNALAVEDDGYVIDTGRRTCYGFNYPKHRREGATYKAELINYMTTTSFYNVHGGIQSMDGSSARKAYLVHLIQPWKKLPFFWKPFFEGSTSPKKEIHFDVPSRKVTINGAMINLESGLASWIDFADSANRDWYDGDKLIFYHGDEVGKTTNENVDERHQVIKKCLAQGGGTLIHGLEINTSTVGEMSKKGGHNFYTLCTKSMYEKRTDLGQTTSGLFNLFIPAHDGLEGFIDIFGDSIIDDPTEDDLWRIPNPYRDSSGNLIGARRFLQIQRDDLLSSEDEESMKDYEEELRLHPIAFDECFITAGSGSGFNLKILTNRIKNLEFDTTSTTRGNFDWLNGIKDGEVIWYEDKFKGRWYKSLEIPDGLKNQRYLSKIQTNNGLTKDCYFPIYPERFVHCGDSYKFLKTETKRMSNGGGACFWKRDLVLDPMDKAIQDWESNRFILSYSNRPWDPDDYAEDMLMQNIYFGGMMFPETNYDLIWKHYVKRNYDGYLLYARNLKGEYWRNTPGFSGMEADKQRIMQLIQQYIELHGHREKHIHFLKECKAIKGIEDFTNYDRFVAHGGALLGAESDYSMYLVSHKRHSKYDIASAFPKKKYK